MGIPDAAPVRAPKVAPSPAENAQPERIPSASASGNGSEDRNEPPCPVGTVVATVQRSRAISAPTNMAMAVSLLPPWGTMMSAWRLEGSTKPKCIGRTWRKYWLTT